jgi:hypothetical protein
MIKKWLSMWLVALGCLGMLAVAVAAEPPPSGTVNISSKTVAIGIGVSWGDGTLAFGGRNYTFSVDGLSVVDLGVSNITSSGEVFNLNKLEDFSGNYAAGEAGIAIAGGPSDTIMKNDKGVVIRLHGTQQGGRLTLAAQGVKLQLKNYP